MKWRLKPAKLEFRIVNTDANAPLPMQEGEEWTDEEIAKKCTPTGKKYGFIEDSDLPADGNFRDAWTYSE